MESNSASSPDLSSAEARAQLAALASTEHAIGDRIATPSWYHPALAALIFVFIVGNASPSWSMLTFLVYCAGLVWLMNTYRRLTGIWVNGWSQRGGRGYAWLLFVVLLAAVGVSFAVRSGQLPAWSVWAAAATAALVAWWAGRCVDVAYGASLAGQ